MKRMIRRVQDLGQKASQLKQALEAAPAKAAELRESVLMTAGQFQQMRHDVQSTMTGLRVDSEDRLAQALREINGATSTLLEAGYELTGVDMDLSPVQRLVVHLEKIDHASEQTIRSLLSANSGRQTVYALLSALAKADAVSEKVRVPDFTYRELLIHLGPTPSVRLCWRTDADYEEAAPEPATVVAGPPPTPPLPAFGQSSFFEPRTPVAARAEPSVSATSQAASQPVESALTPAASAPEAPASTTAPEGHWRQSALDRFKKMPDLSKYRR